VSEFTAITQELLSLLVEWEPKLLALSEDVITYILNDERWSIKAEATSMWPLEFLVSKTARYDRYIQKDSIIMGSRYHEGYHKA